MKEIELIKLVKRAELIAEKHNSLVAHVGVVMKMVEDLRERIEKLEKPAEPASSIILTPGQE